MSYFTWSKWQDVAEALKMSMSASTRLGLLLQLLRDWNHPVSKCDLGPGSSRASSSTGLSEESRASFEGKNAQEEFLADRKAVRDRLQTTLTKRPGFIELERGPWPPDVRSDTELGPRFLRAIGGLLRVARLCFQDVFDLSRGSVPPRCLLDPSPRVTSSPDAGNLATSASEGEGHSQKERGMDVESSGAGQDVGPPDRTLHAETDWPILGQIARHLGRAERLAQSLEGAFQDKELFAESFSGLLSSLGLALLSPVGDGMARLRYRDGAFLLESLDPNSGDVVASDTDLAALQAVSLQPLLEPKLYDFDDYRFVLDSLPSPFLYSRQALSNQLQSCLTALHRQVNEKWGPLSESTPLAERSLARSGFAQILAKTLLRTGLRIKSPSGHPSFLKCSEATGEFSFQREDGAVESPPNPHQFPWLEVVYPLPPAALPSPATEPTTQPHSSASAPNKTEANEQRRDALVGELQDVPDIESARRALKRLKEVLRQRGERLLCPGCLERDPPEERPAGVRVLRSGTLADGSPSFQFRFSHPGSDDQGRRQTVECKKGRKFPSPIRFTASTA